MHVQKLPTPIVLIAPSGEDSLLVYTYENVLYHYIISVADASVKLIQVGQIALHGIIRAPPRVRALSWILPEDQIRKPPTSTIDQGTDIVRSRRSLSRCGCRHDIISRGRQACLTAAYNDGRR
jgi:hypothetical protein